MRKFEFRAWSNSDKRMHDNGYALNNLSLISTGLNEKKDIYVMQCTELMDANGNDIYENDICKGVFKIGCMQGPIVGLIYYNMTNGRYELKSMESSIPLSAVTEIEIIGNTYENPDLLIKQSVA